MRHLPILALVLASATMMGCTVQTRGSAVAYAPARTRVSLVAVGPDVWVVEDSPEPVFYSSTGYYTVRDGAWYRSARPGSGWVVVSVGHVPGHIRAINQPGHYRHWHAPANARRVVRQHDRDHRPPAYR